MCHLSLENVHVHVADESNAFVLLFTNTCTCTCIFNILRQCRWPRLIAGIHEVQTDKHTKIRCIYTVPLTRKVTNLARRSRDTRETLASQNALLAREHSRALESTRNSKWVTRTRTLAGIYYSQEVIVASRVHTRVLFMILFNSNPYARVWLHTQTQTHTASLPVGP